MIAYISSMRTSFFFLSVSLLLSIGFCSCQLAGQAVVQPPADRIHLSQAGYSLGGTKKAVILDGKPGPFFVISVAGDTAFSGKIGPALLWESAAQWAATADFSEWNEAGEYRLSVPQVGDSELFSIQEDANLMVARSLIRSLYFQRSSQALTEEFAGEWARGAGHPDTEVITHPSASTSARPSGSTAAYPGGWYDAGDYGKYTGPTAFVTWSLLHLLELGPKWKALSLNIPESQNQVPDVLDEAMVGLQYLLSLQDTTGAVPHKLTALHHAQLVMPEGDQDARYLIGMSTASTLTFVAATAQASRILRAYEADFPGLADRCLSASTLAWQWCIAHPDLKFKNPSDVSTGEYKDEFLEDEWAWAALELWLTTGDKQYRQLDRLFQVVQGRIPFYGDASWKAMLSLALHRDRLTAAEQGQWREQCLWRSEKMKGQARFNAYQVPLGMKEEDFNWGSNAIHARMGLWYLMSNVFVPKADFTTEAESVGEYLLGKNPLDLCFITDLGSRFPLNIHHRPSRADGVALPVPGLMAGGPQDVVKLQDCEVYPSKYPALRYLDEWCSYSTNEVAINWNANAILLFAWLGE